VAIVSLAPICNTDFGELGGWQWFGCSATFGEVVEGAAKRQGVGQKSIAEFKLSDACGFSFRTFALWHEKY